MNLPTKLSTLIGVGSSICGGSAIAAAAPVIKANDKEIGQAIAVIFFFNVVAAIVFPYLGDALNMSHTAEAFGVFAGTAVNDTSSVVAAGFAFSEAAGNYATMVKYRTIIGNLSDEVDYSSSEDVSMQINNVNIQKIENYVR